LNEFQDTPRKRIAFGAMLSGSQDDYVIRRVKEGERQGSEVRTSIIVLKHWLSLRTWATTRAPSSDYIELLTLRCAKEIAEETPQVKRSHLFREVLKSIVDREMFVLENDAGENVGVCLEDRKNLVAHSVETLTRLEREDAMNAEES